MTDEETIARLTREIEALELEIGTLEDIQAIRALQFKYGYYLDKCLMDEAVDCYADECEVHFMGSIWRGKAGVRRLYVDTIGKLFTGGINGPVDGFMSDYEQLQDIVDVAPNRKTAKGRFRYLMQGATYQGRPTIPGMPPQWFEAGVYENIYVKEDGLWKIRRLDLQLAFRCDYQTGWRYALPGVGGETPKLYPESPTGPDAWEPGRSATWPKAFAQPFHYPHPVTGRFWDWRG
jgi:SnoaL-like domain